VVGGRGYDRLAHASLPKEDRVSEAIVLVWSVPCPIIQKQEEANHGPGDKQSSSERHGDH
jgi:hypothetical protein